MTETKAMSRSEQIRRLRLRYDLLLAQDHTMPHPLRSCHCEWCSVLRDAIELLKGEGQWTPAG
jgi:hypothetical protein